MVLSYALISNERAERMVGTINQSVGKLLDGSGKEWDNMVPKVVYGYRRRPLRSGISLFELLYGVKPIIMPFDVVSSTTLSWKRGQQ